MATTTILPNDLRSELQPEEKVLWVGYPGYSPIHHLTGAVLALLVLGYMVFWEMGIYQRYGFVPFLALGVLGMVICLCAVVKATLIDEWVRRRTVYCLTGRRILIVSRGFRNRVQALDLNRIVYSKVVRSNGRGTIVFGQSDWSGVAPWSLYSPWLGMRGVGPTRFYLIEEVDYVSDLVLSAQVSVARELSNGSRAT